MSDFQDSEAKAAIRSLLRDSCEELGRGSLTYLGLPGERVLDLKALRPLVDRAICVEYRPKVMAEMKRIRKTLGWSDQDGKPLAERHAVSYRELERRAGVSRDMIRAALSQAIGGYFRCV